MKVEYPLDMTAHAWTFNDMSKECYEKTRTQAGNMYHYTLKVCVNKSQSCQQLWYYREAMGGGGESTAKAELFEVRCCPGFLVA